MRDINGKTIIMYYIIILIVVFIMLTTLTHNTSAISWSKYIASNGSFSFHYPAGWVVNEINNTITINNNSTGEQLCLAVLPYFPGNSPRQHAELMIKALQEQKPTITVWGWQSDPYQEDSVISYEMSYSDQDQSYQGMGLAVINLQFEQVLWFHYFALDEYFNEQEARVILEGFVSSLADYDQSKPPQTLQSPKQDRELPERGRFGCPADKLF